MRTAQSKCRNLESKIPKLIQGTTGHNSHSIILSKEWKVITGEGIAIGLQINGYGEGKCNITKEEDAPGTVVIQGLVEVGM